MNYSLNYFGKSLNDLTWEDIEAYFAEAKEETDTVEYKSFAAQGSMDSKYEGIYKAACAFLNSNGGIIIWGSPVGTAVAGRKEKSFHGALSPVTQVLEKDAVISKVSSRITPMPEGINVKIIVNGANCICVFEIQKSQYSPHQTNNTYYMRLDGQSVPAPHYFVEAMFRQIKYPDLEGYVKVNSIASVPNQPIRYYLSLEVYIFNWSALQNETNVSFWLTTNRGTFLNHASDTINRYWLNGKQIICDNIIDVLHHGAPMRKGLTIEIPAGEIVGELHLLLHFGGKNSPLKSSEYKYQIGMQTDPPIAVESERVENIFMHELPQAMAMSKEEKIRIIMGR